MLKFQLEESIKMFINHKDNLYYMEQPVYQILEVDVIKENRLSSSIIKVLAYFDIFKYPLTADEIFEYCDFKNKDFMTLKRELEVLTGFGQIKNSGPYYFIGEMSHIEEREHNNSLSEKLMKKGAALFKTDLKVPLCALHLHFRLIVKEKC